MGKCLVGATVATSINLAAQLLASLNSSAGGSQFWGTAIGSGICLELQDSKVAERQAAAMYESDVHITPEVFGCTEAI